MRPTTPTFEAPPICAEIAARLHAGKRFFFSTHVYPDGDNLGSMTALMCALERMGKECVAHVATIVPSYYYFLEGVKGKITQDLPPEGPDAFDACIIVDSGDYQRMGPAFAEWMAQGQLPLFNIDHHASNTMFGDLVWVDAAYAAVGEQIFELLTTLGAPIDEVIGRSLMCSIMTDTGRFSYQNTSVKTLAYATALVEAGVATYDVFNPIYQSRRLSGLRLQTTTLATLEVDESRGMATFFLTQAMLKESGALLEESEGLIDQVHSIGEVTLSLFFKEARPGDVKLSLRAKVPIDGILIAQLFGGGGHARAAGSTLPGATVAEAMAIALPQIRANVDQQLGQSRQALNAAAE